MSQLDRLDKTHWPTFRFDEIARNVSERVDPGATDLDVYVGLEHIDSGSLHIKRTGTPADVEGQKLRVYPGDIIFGRRRAYQRKAAIATFDGICSAHALVLRAHDAVIDPRLLPFFLHSDAFMHRAIDISVGGLSPTINWGDLKKEEFRLPPRAQQARLAELLWAADAVGEGYATVIQRTFGTRKVLLNEDERAAKSQVSLGELAEVSYGMGVPPKLADDGVPIVRATNIRAGEISAEGLIRTYPANVPVGKRVLLDEGDIIVVRSGAYTGDIGYITPEWAGSLAGYDLVAKPNLEKADPFLLSELLLSDKVQAYFKAESVRNAQPHLNAEQLKNTKLPDFSKEQRATLSNKLASILALRQQAEASLVQAQATKQALLNHIFSA